MDTDDSDDNRNNFFCIEKGYLNADYYSLFKPNKKRIWSMRALIRCALLYMAYLCCNFLRTKYVFLRI